MRKKNQFTRRDFLQTSVMSLTALTLPSCVLQEEQLIGKRPNIFYAIADDWGWPHAPSYGDAVVKTPTFESIARNGILFQNAFVSAPSCTPSRNAILTGQYHWRLGTGANLYGSLPAEHKTYANLLEDNGYFVGTYRKAFGPGKDRQRKAAGKPYESFKAFLDERPADKPFCFWFGSNDPHRGYVWESGIKSGMKLGNVQVPPCLPDNIKVRTDICDYYFEVQRFDSEVGEQLQILEETGELDNTLIVMTADNGWPFPRGKANLYDLGTHVPLAIQWRNKIKKGRVVDDFVSFTDFAPTFLEAAGLNLLPAMTGRSLMKIFESSKSGQVEANRDYVLTGKERHTPCQPESMDGTPMRAIRTKEFLYIHNFKSDRWPAGGPTSMHGNTYADIDDSPTKSEILAMLNDPEKMHFFELSCGKRPADELYDLKKDPHQIKNVAGKPEYAEILKTLKAQLMNELKETNDPRLFGKGDDFDNYAYSGAMKGNKK